MKYVNILIAILAVHFLGASATTWYNFIPYTSTSCTGTPYGVGMSFIGSTCATNFEGAFNQMVSAPTGSTVKVQFYSNYPSSGVCSAPSSSSTYNTNTCQDGGLMGMVNIAGVKWGANYYVNSSTTPKFIYTLDSSNVLFTFMSTDCTSLLGYMYMNGNTSIVDSVSTSTTYNYYCSNGTPYVQTCTSGVCNAAANIASNCVQNSGFYLSKLVACI